MSTTYSHNLVTKTLTIDGPDQTIYHFKVHNYGFSNGELWLDQSVSAPPSQVVPKCRPQPTQTVFYTQAAPAPAPPVRVFYAPAPAQPVHVFYTPAAPAPAPPVIYVVPNGSSTVGKKVPLSLAYQPNQCNATCIDGSPCQNKVAKNIGNRTRCQVHSTSK
jgi:hypothetical protein